MTYQVTKTYGNERGLSCCFRQYKADSHCNLIHGYSLGFSITLESDKLNEKNWVFDFGGFKKLESWLKDTFDHTMVVAEDDPEINEFKTLNDKGLINLKVIPAVGCERFAELVANYVTDNIIDDNNVYVKSVTAFEHNSNSATYIPERGEQ